MGIENKLVPYAGGLTIKQVLAIFRDLMTSAGAYTTDGAGFTLLLDDIAANDKFFVQANQPTEPMSRMILEFRYASISAVDYITIIPWQGWSGSAPTGGRCVVVDTSVNGTSSTTSRFHRLDLTNGGLWYFDYDNTDQRWLSIHSEYNNIENGVHTYIGCCSIESTVWPNYGLLTWNSGSAAYYLHPTEAANSCMWVTPVNHKGFTSTAYDPDPNNERAGYHCNSPCYSYTAGSAQTAAPMCGPSAETVADDTYNDSDVVFPLFIHNSSLRFAGGQNRASNTAYGFRGALIGISGYRRGYSHPLRSTITDGVTGNSYVLYRGPQNIAGGSAIGQGAYCVPKKP